MEVISKLGTYAEIIITILIFIFLMNIAKTMAIQKIEKSNEKIEKELKEIKSKLENKD